MYKRFIYGLSVLTAVCIMVFSSGGAGLADSLQDIPDKYSSEINFLMEQKIVTGYPDQTFRPDVNVTREEAAAMIGRALGLDGTKRGTSFTDVTEDSYASGYIQSAVEKNILTGYEDNSFKPDEKMTRGEMAYLLKRAFDLNATSNVFFSDVAKSGAQYTAINSVVTAGIANGYPNGSYKPVSPINRAEFSLLVARAINPSFRVSSADLIPKDDLVVTASALNMRSGPGTEFDVIGTLASGDKVTTYYTHGEWAYASFGDLKGFVHTAYLSIPDGKWIIAIDAGHGDHDPGSSGNGVIEKELNLSVSLKIKNILEQKGYNVMMTRTDDTFYSLSERVDMAVKAKADAFVSIHGNSAANSSAGGTETYYSAAALNPRAADSKQLAAFIQERLVKALGTRDRGVKESGFYVIKQTPLPAALVELGFLSNPEDASKLSSDEYRNKAAEAIALGIIDYYNWKN